MASRHRFFRLFVACLLLGTLVLSAAPSAPAQQLTTAPATAPPSERTRPPACLPPPGEVVKGQGQIPGWGLETPPKKSLRSPEDIHACILRQMDDEKD